MQTAQIESNKKIMTKEELKTRLYKRAKDLRDQLDRVNPKTAPAIYNRITLELGSLQMRIDNLGL